MVGRAGVACFEEVDGEDEEEVAAGETEDTNEGEVLLLPSTEDNVCDKEVVVALEGVELVLATVVVLDARSVSLTVVLFVEDTAELGNCIT